MAPIPGQPPDPQAPQRGGAAEEGPDLLDLYRRGDELAFPALVEAFQTRLVQFFYRLCWDRDRAEDLTQELFLKLLRTAARYEPQGRLSTYVFRVATNLWIDHYRARRPLPRLYSLDQAGHPSAPTVLETEAAPSLGPEQVAIDAEERALLRAGLEQLTEPHRLVFELAVYQQLPYADISAVLSIPVGTVKSRMHNAVQFLKQVLQRGAFRGRRRGAGRSGRTEGVG
jgi:RNA polymerase sigma-70 factor (ECF subfamily)